MIGLAAASNAADVAAGFRRVADELPGRLEQTISTITGILEDELRAEAPVSKQTPGRKTAPGRLKESIRGEAAGLTGEFFAVDYAWYVIGGTVPHTISGSPLLAFYWDKAGQFVVFASVHHPGTRANDFRLPALMTAADEADDELEALGDWVVAQLNS